MPLNNVAAVLLVCATLLPQCARSTIMSFDFTFEKLKMEILTEGPMWSTAESPFKQPGKKSEVHVVLDWFPESAGDLHTVGLVFTSNATLTKGGGLPAEVLRCDVDLTTPQYEAHYFSDPGTVEAHYEVTKTTVGNDFPRFLLFVCPCVPASAANGLAANDPSRCWGTGASAKKGVQFHGQAAFSNAYGFLSAESFPLLPFYGGLTLAYFVLLVGFVGICFYFRRNLMLLHYATALLAAIGLLECAMYFILYLWKNFTGTSTWPPTPLQWIAAFVGVGKRGLGRVLLLSVALGFGVVKPVLSKATVGLITVLTIAFTALSVWKEVAQDMVYARNPDVEHPVLTLLEGAILAIDIFVLVWCLFALVETQKALQKSRQVAKLRMYNALIAVLLCFIVIWSAFEVYRIAVSKKIIELEWQLTWIIRSFWHVASFAILVTIAIVWVPSETSQDLSYWKQISAGDAEADEASADEEAASFDEVDLQEVDLDPEL